MTSSATLIRRGPSSRRLALAAVGLLLTSMLVALAAPRASAATFQRLAGDDRLATGIAVSQDAFPVGARTAIIANSAGFADALAAAPLAGAEGAPVLLNPAARLDDRVRQELRRLGVEHVLVMGGENALSSSVTSGLRREGWQVTRVSGTSRWATAAAAARRASDLWLRDGDLDAGREVMIALGRHPLGDHRAWPDALAAGVLSGVTHRPLLLIERDAVPGDTLDAIRELGATRAKIVGGPGAIPDATADQLGIPWDRISGPNRYATGVALVQAATAAGADPTDVTIVTGNDFPDALGAVPAALARGGVLLLVDGRDLDGSPAAADWLRGSDASQVRIVGGPNVVTQATVEQIRVAIDGPDDVRLALESVVAADMALAIRFDHLDRMIFAERSGRVRVVVDGQPVTMLDIRGQVATNNERGLLDLVLHPDYGSNRRLFVHHSDSSGDTVLAEYTSNEAGTSVVGGRKVLFRTDQPAGNHNGGGLQFLPDGTLLLALGDGGGSNDQYGNGQDPTTVLGSLLRFDVSTPGVASAPADNPYVGRSGDDLVWATGLRNPFRISLDALTGLLFVADVGQNRWEEVNAVEWNAAGLDYGWSTREGPECFGTETCADQGLTGPVAWYDHGDRRCSITGGYVMRGEIAALRGHYFYGDFCSGQVFSFRLVNGEPTDPREWTADLGSDRPLQFSLVTFGQDRHGELYVANGSQIHKFVRAN